MCTVEALAENGRLRVIDDVLDSFSKLMSSHRGEVTCVITTAKVCTLRYVILLTSQW